jgi:hypothetical protein
LGAAGRRVAAVEIAQRFVSFVSFASFVVDRPGTGGQLSDNEQR